MSINFACMAYLLNIDTAAGEASICLSQDTVPLNMLSNPTQTDHASWIHTAILKITQSAGIQLSQIDAIALTAGPGSYTGLRVGMATAKGLCYALDRPLIAINTLEAMASSVLHQAPELFQQSENIPLICPMIDARRMEVFTALYNPALQTVLEPCAMILSNDSFSTFLESGKLIFTGNGSEKWSGLCNHPHALFKNIPFTSADLAIPAYQRFQRGQFSPLAYTDPIYIKEFYTAPSKNNSPSSG
jgi:tRNA threonylcarbamoyladenosine biosynthesis protein TsaB